MLLIDKLTNKVDFSKSEIIIADFIIQLGEKIKNYSARSIAKETYTSPATVLNLCKKIGIEGFDNFKKAYLPFDQGDTIFKIANKMGSLYEETIKDTLSLLHHDLFQKAVQLLNNNNNIHIYSYGTALNIAESFKEKMMKIGKNVYITNNLNYQRYEVNCIPKGDCVIFISYSGETKTLINMAKTCQKKNIPFLSLTSFGENTLSQMSDAKLYISTRENLTHNIANFNSNLSIYFLLDLLYASYFSLDYENNFNKKLQLLNIVKNESYSIIKAFLLCFNNHRRRAF